MTKNCGSIFNITKGRRNAVVTKKFEKENCVIVGCLHMKIYNKNR
jgi:hypothetical protein